MHFVMAIRVQVSVLETKHILLSNFGLRLLFAMKTVLTPYQHFCVVYMLELCGVILVSLVSVKETRHCWKLQPQENYELHKCNECHNL